MKADEQKTRHRRKRKRLTTTTQFPSLVGVIGTVVHAITGGVRRDALVATVACEFVIAAPAASPY